MAGTALLKHIWVTTVRNDSGGTVLATTQTILGDCEFNELISVAPGATAELDCGTLPFLKMKSVFFVSNVAANVFTNLADGGDEGVTGQTIPLTANVAYAWNETQPSDNPITVDITKIYITNPGTTLCTFRVGILLALLV